jgi:dCTP deaminase
MILTGSEIIKQVKLGKITIDPFVEKNINPNSYNYRLGDKLLIVKNRLIDPKKETETEEIPLTKHGWLLKPGKLYLGHTMESFGSKDFVVNLIGRSSIGRLGLFLQITADLGNLGSSHCWTLELKVVQPLWVYPGMKIGQICFWKPHGDKKYNYCSKYWMYSLPHSSEMVKEFFQIN